MQFRKFRWISAELPHREQPPPPASEVLERLDRAPLRRPNPCYLWQATPTHAVVGAYASNRLRQRPQPEQAGALRHSSAWISNLLSPCQSDAGQLVNTVPDGAHLPTRTFSHPPQPAPVLGLGQTGHGPTARLGFHRPSTTGAPEGVSPQNSRKRPPSFRSVGGGGLMNNPWPVRFTASAS